MRLRYRILLIVMLIFLLAALGLNFYLFNQGRRYYLELSETRLDPLGLNNFQAEAPSSEPSQPLILFYGDSRAMSWPSPDGLDDVTFVNRGIGAQTSTQSWLRFAYHVPPLKPQLFILQVGINDLKTIPLFPERQQSLIETCQENIRHMLAAANYLGATVVLTTIFPVGDVPLQRLPFWSDDVKTAVDTVNNYIHSLGSEHVIIFDAFSILADSDGLMRTEYSADELHINAAGYAALNQALVPVLKTIMEGLQ
jgi:lysophospholipase L1-like esterase